MPNLVVAYNGRKAGLGNRVRVTLGAANLARSLDAPFVYVWPRGRHFGPRFQDLWVNTPGHAVPASASRLVALRTGYSSEKLEHVDDRRIVQIRSGAELQVPPSVRDWRTSFRDLVPVDEIGEKVNALFDAHLRGRPYVGVMVRAHSVSHDRTREASPVDWYVAKMKELQNERPGTIFYLSCDVPEVKISISEQFPGCVASFHDHPYNSVGAVREAAVDLYLLASAGHLLGPHFSSFIEMAEHLSDGAVKAEKAGENYAGSAGWWERPLTEDPLHPADRFPRTV